MDAQLSNNLSRGLSAIAGTVGEYAKAAHEERLQAAKEQFQQMLDDKKQAAEDQRASNEEAQKAADKMADRKLTMQQHADDKAQQREQFEESQTRLNNEFAVTSGQGAERVQVEKDRLAAEQAKTKEPKAPSQANLLARVKETDAALKAAQDDFEDAAGQPLDKQREIGTNYGNRYADAVKAHAAAGMAPPNKVTVGAHASGTPGASPKLMKATVNGQTQFYSVDPSGNKTPISLQQAKQLHQASKASGVTTPSISSQDNTSTDNTSADDTSQDDSADVGANATAGQYAQAQPSPQQAPPTLTPPMPAQNDTQAPVGQPNVPPLAS